MKKIIHKIQLENNEIELNLMTFKKSDRKVFKNCPKGIFATHLGVAPQMPWMSCTVITLRA